MLLPLAGPTGLCSHRAVSFRTAASYLLTLPACLRAYLPGHGMTRQYSPVKVGGTCVVLGYVGSTPGLCKCAREASSYAKTVPMRPREEKGFSASQPSDLCLEAVLNLPPHATIIRHLGMLLLSPLFSCSPSYPHPLYLSPPLLLLSSSASQLLSSFLPLASLTTPLPLAACLTTPTNTPTPATAPAISRACLLGLTSITGSGHFSPPLPSPPLPPFLNFQLSHQL